MVDKKVVWLQVAVNDPFPVQVLNPQYHFRDVFLCPVLGKTAQDLHKRSTIASIEIFHYQVEVLLAGKRPIEFRNKVTLPLQHHNGSFSLDIACLVLSDHVGLLEYFDGEVFTSGFLF